MSGKKSFIRSNRKRRTFDGTLKGLRQGNAWQTRYFLTPKEGLNNETVGGIWDMKIESKINKAIIRFDNGYGRDPHVNIDLTRYKSDQNLYIPVPENIIKTAEILNNTLHYATSAVFFSTIALDAYRLGSAIKIDFHKQREADDVLKWLDEVLGERKGLENGKTAADGSTEEHQEVIEHYEGLKKEYRLAKDKVPCESIITGSAIAGGWIGGTAGAVGGGWVGMFVGDAAGQFFGNFGPTIGAFVGTIVGSFGGGIYGGIKGSDLGEIVGDAALKVIYDKKYKN